MTSAAALEWFRDMLYTAVIAASPAVLTVVIVGLIMAILQAATQINDQAVAFGPKAIAVIVALSVGGSFTLNSAADFTKRAIGALASVTPSGALPSAAPARANTNTGTSGTNTSGTNTNSGGSTAYGSTNTP